MGHQIPQDFTSRSVWYKARESHSALRLPRDGREPHPGNDHTHGSLEMLISRKISGFSCKSETFGLPDSHLWVTMD